MRRGVLLVGHGSREATANAELEAIVAGFAAHHHARSPADVVTHAYVELAEPALAPALDALAARVDHVVVVPLLLFAAGHVKNDLPLALYRARAAWPRVRFTAARALGVHGALVDVVVGRARAALDGAAAVAVARTAVIVVGRGSSDPDANGDFCKLVRLVGEQLGGASATPAFAGVTTPRVDEALELATRARPERLVLVPYLLCAGRVIDRLHAHAAAARARYPWIELAVAAHLGDDPRLHGALDDRLAEAIAGAAPLPCDTCQYRVPIGPVAEVGGLRALLWSVRHGVTHTQARPHEHAHRPFRKHVLVCGNADCAARGSIGLLVALRRELRDSGQGADIRITRTSCMGRCGEGPTVAVYPDGVWYRGVGRDDARALVHDHLLGDQLVAGLVDHILQ